MEIRVYQVAYLIACSRAPEFGKMDAKDVRIFCEMAFKDLNYSAFTSRHINPSAIARKLGLDEKTVRVRVKNMEDKGFIKYYQAMPSVSLLGLKSIGSYRFEAVNIATKHRVVENVQQVPYVVEAFDYLGPVAAVTIAGASSHEVQLVANGIAKRFELNKMHLGDRVVREPLSRPDKLDWQIIKKLRYDARGTSKEIADALQITPRMAGYRITKLLDSGAVLIRAVINTQKQEGMIFYELEISVDDARQNAVARQVSEMYGEKLWSMQTSTAGILLANLFGFTLGEPEEAVMSLLKVEGVHWCSLFILKEIIEPRRPNWIDKLIEEKIAAGKS